MPQVSRTDVLALAGSKSSGKGEGNVQVTCALSVSIAAEARVRDDEACLAGCVRVEEGVGPGDLTRGKSGLDTREVRPDPAAGLPPAVPVPRAGERSGVEAHGSSLDPDRIIGKPPYELLEAPKRVAMRRLLSRFD
jgi:hypothetical protein